MRKIWEVNVYDANFVYYRIQLFYCNIEVSTHVLCFEIIHLIIVVHNLYRYHNVMYRYPCRAVVTKSARTPGTVHIMYQFKLN